MKTKARGKIVGNRACPTCQSQGRDSTGNHVMMFEDGGGYCNRCDTYYKPADAPEKSEGPRMKSNSTQSLSQIKALKSLALPTRGLTAGAVEHFGIKCEVHPTTKQPTAYYFPVTEDGELVGYKKKSLSRSEKFAGPHVGTLSKHCDLFGSESCNGSKKRLIITEGQEDAVAAWLLLTRYAKGGKYANKSVHVVSLQNGAGSTEAAIKANWDFLNKYSEIYLALDQDEEGEKATMKLARALGHKIVKTMTWGHNYKDPNAMLMDGSEGQDSFINSYFDAQEYMPAGLISGSQIDFKELWKPTPKGLALPYKQLTLKLGGLREGELTLVTAPPGVGKSSICRGIMNHIASFHNQKVGIFGLEEDLKTAALSQIALSLKTPYNRLCHDTSSIDKDDKKAAQKIIKKYFTFSDNSFGSLDVDLLVEQLHFMVYNQGIKYILLDHINMVVSGTHGDERETIDYLMTKLAAFVTKSQCHIIAIAHLNRNSGKENMKGGVISMSDLRGSSGLEQLSFNIIALTRDLTDEEESKYATLRLLKNRHGGTLGIAGDLEFNKETGWYEERT